MVIAGSMTVAYRMKLVGGVVVIEKATYPLRECDKPNAAVAKVLAGGEAIVSGGDAYAVRVAITGKTARGESAR